MSECELTARSRKCFEARKENRCPAGLERIGGNTHKCLARVAIGPGGAIMPPADLPEDKGMYMPL